MVQQVIRFESLSLSEIGSGAITAFLFSGTTLAATLANITENGTLKGRYTGTVDDIAVGEYRLVVKFNGYTVNEPDEVVTLLLAAGTYSAERHAVLNTEGQTAIANAVDTKLSDTHGDESWEGGMGDATLANQEIIIAKTNLIGTAAGITNLLAAVLTPGTIVGFPATITIGDSYTTTNGHAIDIPIVDADGEPISSSGSLDFEDATVSFTIRRAKELASNRVITGTAMFVPGDTPKVRIQLSSSETSKGLVAYKYAGVLKFTWTSPSTEVISFETTPIQFDN